MGRRGFSGGSGGGGGGGSPTGAAGGSLTGTYPNPGLVASTTSVPGSMSAADKVLLNRLTAGVSVPAALAIDWSLSTVFSKSISTNSTFTFSNVVDGEWINVAITDTNSSTVTWPTVLWVGGAAPVQTTSGTDVYTFIRVGSTTYGTVVQGLA